jgi:DNA (cytosine-5)-methyltransferase 1
MGRPLLIDLFCGGGGAAMGYHQAGFDVIGVDIEPQPHYPFPFIQADALAPPLDLARAEMIHASPPCQGYSRMRHLPWIKGKDYPLLIDATRAMLRASGRPWVIENVEDAPMPQSTVLCGWTLGLPLYRHRRFEASFLILCPPHRRHTVVIHKGRRNLSTRYRQGCGRDITGLFPGATAEDAGFAGMTRAGAAQAIPPAYTRHIGAAYLATYAREDKDPDA